jgi:hypothetical protein
MRMHATYPRSSERLRSPGPTFAPLLLSSRSDELPSLPLFPIIPSRSWHGEWSFAPMCNAAAPPSSTPDHAPVCRRGHFRQGAPLEMALAARRARPWNEGTLAPALSRNGLNNYLGEADGQAHAKLGQRIEPVRLTPRGCHFHRPPCGTSSSIA